ncbi:MAG: RNA-binding cell elongation regulator Jag/EloR [Clostridia bacterium]
MKKIETAGKTLDIAVDKALTELNITREEADVVVLQEGKLLKPFKVQVSTKLTDGEKAQKFLEELLAKMKFNYVVNLIEDSETVKLDLVGVDQGSVIGYRGEVLDALQYLASLIVNEDKREFKRIVVDSEAYREKREQTLIQLAHNLENKVVRTHKYVKLEPMNPYERRIIHTALQDSEYVTTESEGTANSRHVVISPKDKDSDILQQKRTQLNFVYRSDKKKR